MLKTMSEEVIKEYFTQVFANQIKNYYDWSIRISKNTAILSQEYEYFEFSQSHLFKLCLLFDTDNIVIDKDYSLGCESCDLGSSYRIEFEINKPTKEWENMKQTMKEFVELQNKKEIK